MFQDVPVKFDQCPLATAPMIVQTERNILIKRRLTPELLIAHPIIRILPLAVEVALRKVSKPLAALVLQKEVLAVHLVKV